MKNPLMWLSILSDEQSMKIISCTSTGPLTVSEISKACSMPLAACYRKVEIMKKDGILEEEKDRVRTGGKPSKRICSSIKRFDILYAEAGIIMELERRTGKVEVIHLNILTDAVKTTDEKVFITMNRKGRKGHEEEEHARIANIPSHV